MTSPPPKRLRRTTVVSSDDEDSAADSQTSTASLNVTAQSLNLRKNSQSQEIRLRKSIKSSSKGTKKVTASKAKAIIAKGNNITKNASIYSFFTGATQSNSQSPLRNKSPEDENNPLSPEDLIEDNYSDDPRFNVSLRTSQYREDGSRSLNGQASKGTHVESSIVAKSKQFSTKVLAISPKNSITISTSVDSRPWADLYPPESLDELVVHKRKVADVHRWLVNVKEGRERKRLLVLKGPSGSGKTATLRCLARELGNEIIEWENPIGSSIEEEGFISLGIQFDEFLTRTINFKRLELSDDQEVIPNIANSSAGMIVLIEDFPNTFAKGSKALMNFRDSVLRYLVASTPPPGSQSSNSTITPIVMTVTETHITSSTNHSDSFTVGKLLGPQILQHLGVTVIEFNSVAPTLLSKAITTVIRKDNRRNSTSWSLGTGLIKKLSQSGDIRSSINSLQLTHLFDRVPSEDCQPTRSANKIISKSHSSAGPKQKSPVIDFRDSIVDLFHAVGKILYNKRKEANTETPVQPAAHLPHHTRPRASEVSIDSLHEEITSDIDTFISTLHENYPLSCYGVDFTDSLDDCITHFSDADLILSSSNNNNTPSTRTLGKQPPSALQSDYAFQITSRGLLFSLPHPIERGKTLAAVSKLGRDPFKMVYPAALRLWRLIEDNETIIDAWNEKLSQQELMGECTRISRSDIVTQLVPYASKISIPDPVSAGAKGRGKANHGYGFVDAEEELQTNSVPLLSVLTLPLPPAIASTAVANNERKNVVQSGSLAMLPLKEQSLVLSEDDIEDD